MHLKQAVLVISMFLMMSNDLYIMNVDKPPYSKGKAFPTLTHKSSNDLCLTNRFNMDQTGTSKQETRLLLGLWLLLKPIIIHLLYRFSPVICERQEGIHIHRRGVTITKSQAGSNNQKPRRHGSHRQIRSRPSTPAVIVAKPRR